MQRALGLLVLGLLVVFAFALHAWAHDRRTPSGHDLAIVLVGLGAVVLAAWLGSLYAQRHGKSSQ